MAAARTQRARPGSGAPYLLRQLTTLPSVDQRLVVDEDVIEVVRVTVLPIRVEVPIQADEGQAPMEAPLLATRERSVRRLQGRILGEGRRHLRVLWESDRQPLL